MERTTNRIVLSEMDFQRIKEDIQNFRFQGDARLFGYVNNLEKELHHARVVPPEEIEADVVTMNSTVRVMDVKTKESTVYTLVYPHDANIDENKISVLSPIGCALIGCRVGEVVDVKVPSGVRQYRIEELLYQPEAAGELHR
ncbi:MAG: nucleoside diphosphate kinase regulator [Candidatus Omnitrophica bacterium]|nr:nucleoside diphosphate kinase regulator [Candidatus Omnitrophota bacterium]